MEREELETKLRVAETWAIERQTELDEQHAKLARAEEALARAESQARLHPSLIAKEVAAAREEAHTAMAAELAEREATGRARFAAVPLPSRGNTGRPRLVTLTDRRVAAG